MTDCELSEALDARASEAPAPPPDLLARVETRFRRRRRRQAVGGTFAAVLVLALGGWAGFAALPQRANHPATPVAQPPAFRIPASLANPPLITDAWPAAIVVEGPLATSPSGHSRPVLGRIDATHLLVGDQNNFYSYDGDSRTFRTLVTGTGSSIPQDTGRIALSPHWIVWPVNDQRNDRFSIYRAPVAGGDRQLVAVVRQPPDNGGYYATDEFVYWSRASRAGVTRLSMSDGTVGALPGFEDMETDGTPWAETAPWTVPVAAAADRGPPTTRPQPTTWPQPVALAFRNLVTGERRIGMMLPDTKSIQCMPAFCIGRLHGDRGEFVQRLDGSGRALLGNQATPAGLLSAGDGGFIILGERTVLDPMTGKLGTIPSGKATTCGRIGGSTGTDHGMAVVAWWDSSDRSGKSCPAVPPHRVYLPGPD
jgi:hypothetical protein